MIWYKFHIGDYLTHTVHLSDAEDLAYRRLLDLYYMSEKEIPLDTESVLGEFFEKTSTGYFNNRCHVEVAKYQHQVENNRQLGKRGGRPLKTESKTESKANHNPKKIQIQKKNINTSSKFDEFWQCWPASKRKVAKSECQKKWAKAGLDSVADAIVSHVNAIKVTEQWTSGYEPAPLTYINQRRWEDDAGTPAVGRRVI